MARNATNKLLHKAKKSKSDDKESGEELSFKYYDKEVNAWLSYTETVGFNTDMILGDAFEPIELSSFSTSKKSISLDSSSVRIFPSPTSDILRITGVNQPVNIKLYSIIGQFVKSFSGVENHIDISDITPGIYFISITTGDISIVRKIMIER